MLEFFPLDSTKKEVFMNLLPVDWKAELQTFLADHSQEIIFYGILNEGTLLGGGCIFSGFYPEKKGVNSFLDNQIEKNMPYLGFLWINPSVRQSGMGSFFLKSIKKYYSKENFWLVCAETLVPYYEKREFYVLDSWNDPEENEKQYLMMENKILSLK